MTDPRPEWGELTTALADLLVDDGISFDHPPGTTVLLVPVQADSGERARCFLDVDEDERAVTAITRYDEVIDDSRHDDVVELLNRINRTLRVGAFVLDYERGQVEVRSGVEFGAAPVDPAHLRRLVATNLGLAERHRPAIGRVSSLDWPPTADR